jgi:hypothetical protein
MFVPKDFFDLFSRRYNSGAEYYWINYYPVDDEKPCIELLESKGYTLTDKPKREMPAKSYSIFPEAKTQCIMIRHFIGVRHDGGKDVVVNRRLI